MNRLATTCEREQMRQVFGAVLREIHGAGVSLEDWSACPVSKRGRHRAVRYDLDIRADGVPQHRRHHWVGKFYEQDEEPQRVAAVLRKLAATDCHTRGDVIIPRALAFHAPFHLLLLAYEPGMSATAALAQNPAEVLPAIGRALAALHATPLKLDGMISVAALLDEMRRKIASLCGRFPAATTSLRHAMNKLEREAPCDPATPSFLHGDLGPVQLLWQWGRIVILDFDHCTHGDPALDLGNLLTQLRRLTLRKPGKLPEFVTLRSGLLNAYRRSSETDPDFPGRIAWHERVMLLRKIGFLASDTTRHGESEATQARQAEALRLLEELPVLMASD